VAGLARRREATDRRRVGPSCGPVARRWNAFLDTPTDEQLEFAAVLLRRVSELKAEEIRRLRGGAEPTAHRSRTEQ
jgi:hypothetical protein